MSYFFKIAQKSNRQKVSVWTNSSAYGLSCHVGEANCHASKQTNLLPFYMGSCFTRSPQSHRCLNGFFLTVFIVTVSFCVFLSKLSELVWKLAEEILQSALKRFPSFGPPANGNKSNAKKIPISSKSKRNGNNISLICNPETF